MCTAVRLSSCGLSGRNPASPSCSRRSATTATKKLRLAPLRGVGFPADIRTPIRSGFDTLAALNGGGVLVEASDRQTNRVAHRQATMGRNLTEPQLNLGLHAHVEQPGLGHGCSKDGWSDETARPSREAVPAVKGIRRPIPYR